MNYDNIQLVKIVTGEMVIGVREGDKLEGVAMVQIVPISSNDMQIAILPYGFPFEETVEGVISANHIVYTFESVSEDLVNKYIETRSNITIQKTPLSGGNSGLIL